MVQPKGNVGRAATIRIAIRDGITMELDGIVTQHVGNMVGIKAFSTKKVYHLYQYKHTQGANVYEGTLHAGKRRLAVKARLL